MTTTTPPKPQDGSMPEKYKGFCPCKACGYTAPPELVKTSRKHFDAHAFECTRCLWKPETQPTEELALIEWNTCTSSIAEGLKEIRSKFYQICVLNMGENAPINDWSKQGMELIDSMIKEVGRDGV